MTPKHVISSYNTLLEKTIVTEGWQIMRKQPYWLMIETGTWINNFLSTKNYVSIFKLWFLWGGPMKSKMKFIF